MALNKENQIKLDLNCEVKYEEENTTISGKPYADVKDKDKYTLYDFEVGATISGIPEITYFENKDRKSDSLRVRILDDEEFADLYINIPKPDEKGIIRNIRKGHDFYRTCFDFIYSVRRWEDEHNVITSEGEEANEFDKVKIFDYAKYVDMKKMIDVKIIEGNKDSDYNSWIIYNMR